MSKGGWIALLVVVGLLMLVVGGVAGGVVGANVFPKESVSVGVVVSPYPSPSPVVRVTR
ncbi:MAG: hypothetical protein ACXWFU_08445 [Actinomycetota bacterium]